MSGSVLFTGANSSLGIPAVKYLLDAYSKYTLILTVRDDSDQDENTLELRKIVSGYPNASTSIRKLNLASLKEVEHFANSLCSEIDGGKIPRLVAIICNAMSWKLMGGPSFSEDGHESSIAINHLAHFALTLRLLSAMDTQRGRIVFLGSEAHRPLESGLSKGFPTHIPDDLNLLVDPPPDKKEQEVGRGFQRYGTSKLVITMVSYELSRRLKANKDTQSIRTITIDPKGLLDSKTFLRSHVPMYFQILIKIGSWLLPLLQLFLPGLASVAQAAKPVVDIAVADEFAGREGYFEGREAVQSSPESMDQEVQAKLWKKSVEWCGFMREDVVIEL